MGNCLEPPKNDPQTEIEESLPKRVRRPVQKNEETLLL
jgi:hypothetical protein